MYSLFTYITNATVEVKLLLIYYARKLFFRKICDFNVININFVIFFIFLSLLSFGAACLFLLSFHYFENI